LKVKTERNVRARHVKPVPGALPAFTVFVKFYRKSGLSNRAMQLLAILWLCGLCKVTRVYILEETSAWATGSLANLLRLPRHLNAIGIEKIELVDITDANREAWFGDAEKACAAGTAFMSENFLHPRHVAQYALEILQWAPSVASEVITPMTWVQTKVVAVPDDVRAIIDHFIKDCIWKRGGPRKMKDDEVLKLGMHVRSTDMTDTLHGTGEQSKTQTFQYLEDLVWEVAQHVRDWQGKRGCLIMVAADHWKTREGVTAMLDEVLCSLQVCKDKWRLVFACTCKWNKDHSREANAWCYEHERGAGFKPAGIGQVREGDNDQLISDIYMLSRTDRFFSMEWTSLGDFTRYVRGHPFEQDCVANADRMMRSAPG
jgi:hypothetical protein